MTRGETVRSSVEGAEVKQNSSAVLVDGWKRRVEEKRGQEWSAFGFGDQRFRGASLSTFARR